MTTKRAKPIKITLGPPFETSELRKSLTSYLTQLAADSHSGTERRLGNFKFGVYAFYDYDGEPIYVGQTNEKLSTRIRRHLTNQRTDAVAMKVLDPFEVREFKKACAVPCSRNPNAWSGWRRPGSTRFTTSQKRQTTLTTLTNRASLALRSLSQQAGLTARRLNRIFWILRPIV